MRRFLGMVALVLVLGEGAGCVTRSSHTEGDREVNDQQKKGGAVVMEANAAAADAIDAGDYGKAKTLLAVGAEAGAVIIENAKQQEKVHGAPERPDLPAFSAEASAAARKKSTDDHANSKWVTGALVALGAVGSIAATLAGMPWLAQLFPALTGKIGVMAKTGVEIINNVRATAQKNGGTIDVKTVLEIAKDKNVSAGIQKLVDKHAHAHEDAMNLPLTSLVDMDGDGIDDRTQEPSAARGTLPVAAPTVPPVPAVPAEPPAAPAPVT